MSRKFTNKEIEKLLAEGKLIVSVVPEIIKATKNLGKGEIEIPQEIQEIEALIFSRGKLNAQFFRGIRKNYIVPNWVEGMLNPKSKGVVSLGHSSWFINSNYRDWMAFGGLDCIAEGTITRNGLVIPLIDSYSLLTGVLVGSNGYYITQDGKSQQELLEHSLPIGVNKWKLDKKKYKQTVFGSKVRKSEIGVLRFEKEKESTKESILLSVRPFNQEGIALIHSITYRPKDHAIIINKELAFKIVEIPEKIAVGNYQEFGDSAVKLIELAKEWTTDQELTIECDVGLANMTFIFPAETQKIRAFFRMTKEPITAPPTLEKIAAYWREKLALGMQLQSGNQSIDRLYKANLANLLLLVDPGNVTPGPTIYHRFWCRDAAYLINALDKTGYHNYARDALEQFIIRQRKDGFYYSHEGEFDSNGEGIWAFAEHAKFTKDIFWLEKVFESITKAAEWLIDTRKQEKALESSKKELVEGLLPPGYSAEHLGPCDYFYWDNFWGVTGLREASNCAKMLESEKADELESEFRKYSYDLNASLEKVYKKLQFLPVGPFRECDSAMIANMVAWHPTKILHPKNEMLMNTVKILFDKFTIDGGFFHEVAWNCYGTYLTMHLAQAYAGINDSLKVYEIIKWLINNQSCTMGWAEGISPQTMQGGMGDSPHGWASADWILLLRNMFANEINDNSLELLNGFPKEFLSNGISCTKLETYFGEVNYTAKLVNNKLILKFSNELTIKDFKIRTPQMVNKIVKGNDIAEIVGNDCIKVQQNAKELEILLQ